MNGLILAGLLPLCLAIAFFLLNRPLREFFEEFQVEQARESFRPAREQLEARFLKALDQIDPVEAARWDTADWRNDVYWARDRQSRRLLALVCVHFPSTPFHHSGVPEVATAVFEYRKGEWRAEGKRLAEVSPDEVVRRDRRFEPVRIL